MANSISRDEASKVFDAVLDWYQDFCEDTSNEGAMMINRKNNNHLLIFKTDLDTAMKIYNYAKDNT